MTGRAARYGRGVRRCRIALNHFSGWENDYLLDEAPNGRFDQRFWLMEAKNWLNLFTSWNSHYVLFFLSLFFLMESVHANIGDRLTPWQADGQPRQIVWDPVVVAGELPSLPFPDVSRLSFIKERRYLLPISHVYRAERCREGVVN